MPKRKKERRFFGLFPGRSNSFAPPTRTDDTSSVNAAVLAGIIVSLLVVLGVGIGAALERLDTVGTTRFEFHQ